MLERVRDKERGKMFRAELELFSQSLVVCDGDGVWVTDIREPDAGAAAGHPLLSLF